MSSATELTGTGIALIPEDENINLPSGWNIISYLRNTPLDVETAVATLTDDEALVIMKDNFVIYIFRSLR